MRQLATLLLCCCVAQTVLAASPIHIGVLAFRPTEAVQKRWQPLARYLEQAIPGTRFSIEVMTHAKLDQATRRRKVQLVLTNPGHYLQLHARNGLGKVLVTKINRMAGFDLGGFGGVAFTLAGRTDIDSWEDLAGKRVAFVARRALGGYQMQAYELLRRGLDPEHAIVPVVSGMPHDRSVYAVLSGDADAGFARSGVLESMASEGVIDLSRLKVIAPQPLGKYPATVSTPLYPEWPLAAINGFDDRLSTRIADALIHMRERSPQTAGAIGLSGFASPADYTVVSNILRALGAAPFEPTTLNWRHVLEHYRWQLIAAVASVLFFALWFWLGVYRRQHAELRDSLVEQKRLNQEKHLLSYAFNSDHGMLITDRRGRIQRVNDAFVEITGYTAEEALGEKPGNLLNSGKQDAAFYRDMWRTIGREGAWHGEIWNRHKNGELFPELLTITAVTDETGEIVNYVASFTDISELKNMEQRLSELAFYDPLTGLPNRHLAIDRLRQALADSKRHEHWGSLLFIDLDHFKQVNDTEGHDAGDECLMQVARRMQRCLREVDTLGRVGGDEFIAVITNLGEDVDSAPQHAETVARKLIAAVETPFVYNDNNYHLSASIGIALFHDHGQTTEELMRQADAAMYEVKHNGRSGVRFYDGEMDTALHKRLLLEQALRDAIERKEFLLLCQPKVDTQGCCVGGELLLRWRHPERGLLAPGEFLPIAEETGLIHPIGLLVLEEARSWIEMACVDPRTKGLIQTFNLSAEQFRAANFIEQIQLLLDTCPSGAVKLEADIPEAAMMEDPDHARALLHALRAHGVRIAMDNFGVGHSSLAYLAQLPLDVLKIDRVFTEHLEANHHTLKAIIAMAKALNLETLAEGVETQTQWETLKALGCNRFQGYYFSQPLAQKDFFAYARRHHGNDTNIASLRASDTRT